MKFRTTILRIVLALALILRVVPAFASQATLVTPGPPLPMTGLASFLNAAFLSIGSCNSGNSAPANGTGGAAFAGECWINTTTNPWVFSYYDGASWVEFGSLNTSTHVWTATGSAAFTGTTNTVGTINSGIWNGTAIGIAYGGTGQTTAAAGFAALAPTPTRAGDIQYWNGSAWVTVAGNKSGTNCLVENASGVPNFASCAGSSGVSGPGSSTNNDLAAFNGTTGTVIKDSGIPLNAYPAADLSYTAPGTGAVSRTVQKKLAERISTADFGALCNGSNDNTTAFYDAGIAALAYSGEVNVVPDDSGGTACEWQSQIVWAPLSSTEKRLAILIAESIEMLFNGSTGGLAFSGEGGTRMTAVVKGGYWYPYSAGSGWAVEFLANEHSEFDDFDYNIYGTTSNTANIALFDNVFDGRMSNWTGWGCANGVLLRNASNHINITGFDLEHCTTEGIYSANNTITASTNASTSSSSAVLSFATAPGAMVGQVITNNTHPSSITAGTAVLSVSGTTVTMSADAASTVSSGDSITFTNANSSANQLSNGYIEQVSNSIDASEAGDGGWSGTNLFINQGDYLGSGSYDLHVVGGQDLFANVQIVGSSSLTNIHNDSVYSSFWNIAGVGDTGADYFFRNHTAAQGTSFCGNYSGTLPGAGFYADASSTQNNPLPCSQANVNGNALTYTVVGLPACNTYRSGQRAFVIDGTSVSWQGPATGGGSTKLAVTCNGGSWLYD